MATINAQVQAPDTVAVTVTWPNLSANGDVGEVVIHAPLADRSVQIEGNFGTSGAVTVEGSNDGVNYKTLTDPLGNALVVTAANIKAVSEATRYIRPRVSAGSGMTLTVTLFARR